MGKRKHPKQSAKTVASTDKRFIRVTKSLKNVLFTPEERKQSQHRHFSITHFQDGRILLEPATQNRYHLRRHAQSRGMESSASKPRYSEKQRTNILCQTSSQDCPNSPDACGAHISDDALFFYDVRRRRRAPHSGGVDNALPASENKLPQIVGGQPPVAEKDLVHLPRRVSFSDSEHLPDDKQLPTVGGQPSALDQYLAGLLQLFGVVKTEALSESHLVAAQQEYAVGGFQENSGVSSANEVSTGESRYPTDYAVGEHIRCNYIPANDCESKSGGLSEVASCYTEP